MKITINEETINILKVHLADWNAFTGAEDELTPEVVERLVKEMIYLEADERNLFEDYVAS